MNILRASHATVGGEARIWLPEMPLLAEDAAIAHAPRIVAISDERAYLIEGDQISVKGDVQGGSECLIVRPGTRLHDPVSGLHLGNELLPLGKAKFVSASIPVAVITQARRDIVNGDLLWPLPPAPSTHGEENASMPGEAMVVSTMNGGGLAGQYQIVGINKGSRDNVSEGARLALFAAGSRHGRLKLRESGRMVILRVFPQVSYGVITHAVEPLQMGDTARVPEGDK